MTRISAYALGALAIVAVASEPADAADDKRKPPYFASIGAGRARMRTGPARTYPASWLYQRADLPVRVVGVFKEWRKIADPDGTEGWMQANLLRNTRTAIVRGAEPAELRDQPTMAGKLLWRAAPGVVGRLSACGNGWCRLDVKGQAGFVPIGALWGVEAGETLP
ncbi:SH3 domain-containing protein [Sphingomonas sp. PB2P19]|uniref:SH3 domain-containing protein n=1 Tax=Sphingomonas rhamnosi TaxID=3096156 RepID=UPI002FC90E65